MPTLATTIEDTAPVIVYSVNNTGGSDWRAGSSSDDAFVDRYSQSSYMLTEVERADASFTFFGTGVQLYGSKRSNHGLFQISIDSVVYPPVNGSMSNDSGTYQFPLFSTVALIPGWHTVRMTNLEAKVLDIDFITYQTPVGPDNEALLSTTIQDSESPFTYSPASKWSASPADIGMFSAGSGHVTGAGAGGATVEFAFEGDSVALFGPVGPSGAPYSVQLDDGSSTKFSTNKEFYRPQQMLFSTGHLGGGKHVIRLQSQAANDSASTLAIDFAEVFTTASLQRSNHAGLSAGVVTSIAIAGTLIIILPILYFFFRRRQKQSRRRSFRSLISEYDRPMDMDVSPPLPYTGTTTQHLLYSPSYQQWLTPSPGRNPSHESFYDMTSEMLADGSNRHTWQTVTVPFTADGKYRPDLSNPVQLQDPPGGGRRPFIRVHHYSPPAQTNRGNPFSAESNPPQVLPALAPVRKT